eukprot:2460785-Amphidinium_carterae.1
MSYVMSSPLADPCIEVLFFVRDAKITANRTGQWLLAIPRAKAYLLTDEEYKHGLQMRLGIPM